MGTGKFERDDRMVGKKVSFAGLGSMGSLRSLGSTVPLVNFC